MDHPAYDPTLRARRVAAQRMVNGDAVSRGTSGKTSGLLARLFSSVTLWVAGAIVLAPLAANAQEAQDAGGPIVIPGNAEKNPAALAALAEHMEAAPAKRVGSAATLAAATAQSLSPGQTSRENRDADSFARAANESGSIVIPGAGETPAAPRMIRTSFKPDANGVVTIPAPVNAQPVAANAPSGAPEGFDSLASRGEPPQFGANGKPIMTRVAFAPAAPVAPVATVTPVATPAVRTNARPVANAAAVASATPAAAANQANSRPVSANANASTNAAPAAAQSTTPPGQQDPQAIRTVALAFLQQQATGLPGKVEITLAPAFQRGLAACTGLVPFMPSGARMWGSTSVGVRCAGEHPWTIYLAARISLHATYYLAARAMSPGEVLTAADLVARDGDLTGLPQAIVTDPSQVVGSVTLMRVSSGMPLRRDMLRSASAVTIGQTVRVVAAGDGFAISAEGNAMNNASPGQRVQVKTANGQVISGIVKDGGTVEIQL